MAKSSTDLKVDVPSPTDGEAIFQIAREITLFDERDVETIQELWMEFASKGDIESWYHFLAAYQTNTVVGFACFGRRPLTEGTFDLYWIATDRNHHRQGIGEGLIRAVEEKVKGLKGHMLIAETAGKPEFDPTRNFYLGIGYQLEGRLKDFYAPGDDLMIFTKHFPLN